jgi:TctA family transporter
MGRKKEDGPIASGTAFGLWLACLFGLCGIHRFYLNRPGTGILYLLTFGLFGIGQLVDLFRIPGIVRDENNKALAFEALAEKRALASLQRQALLPAAALSVPVVTEDPEELMRRTLLTAASKHGGKLSVTQGVMATGKSFEVVEAALDAMAKSGYVGIDNDIDTGAVVYTFGELG